MRKLLLISALFLGVTTFQSCTDPCQDVVCQNGGTCDDGTCDCPAGFTGTNCETIDVNNIQGASFIGTIDGVSVSYIEGQGNYQNYQFESGGWGTSGNLSYKTFGGGVRHLTTEAYAGIEKGTWRSTEYGITNSQMMGFWAVGSHPFSVDAEEGVQITWGESSNPPYWSSGNSGGVQPASSSFEITHVSEFSTIFHDYVKVVAEVTCVLYDENGNTKDLDGTFVILVRWLW